MEDDNSITDSATERKRVIEELKRRSEYSINGPSKNRSLVVGIIMLCLGAVMLAFIIIDLWLWFFDKDPKTAEAKTAVFGRAPYASWKTWMIWWNMAWPLLVVVVFVWSLFHWIFLMEFKCT